MIFATGSSKPDGPGAFTNFLRSRTVASCDAAAGALFCCADMQNGTATKIKIARIIRFIASLPLSGWIIRQNKSSALPRRRISCLQIEARTEQIRAFPLEASSGFRKITDRQGIWARAPAQRPVLRRCTSRSELARSERRAIHGKRAGHRSECAWRFAANEKLSDDGHRSGNHESADGAKGAGADGRGAAVAWRSDPGHRHRVADAKRIVLGIEFPASQDQRRAIKPGTGDQVRRTRSADPARFPGRCGSCAKNGVGGARVARTANSTSRPLDGAFAADA